MDEKQRAKCARYVSRVLTLIPPQHQQFDASHASIVYFGVTSLEILGAPPAQQEVEQYLQLLQTPSGFKMSPSYLDSDTHLTATYFCLALRNMASPDGASPSHIEVNSANITKFLGSCQKQSGSFSATPRSSECSMRHTYSAFAVTKLLETSWDFEGGGNKELAINYILSCQNYDGGFGDKPGDESHAGLTFCAVASLKLANALHRIDKRLVSYLAKRQTELGGHNGRPNKDTDVCYSFWVLCSTAILGIEVSEQYKTAVREYLLGPGYDDLLGGFVKVAGEQADPYHTALALCALACLEGKFDPVLALPKKSSN